MIYFCISFKRDAYRFSRKTKKMERGKTYLSWGAVIGRRVFGGWWPKVAIRKEAPDGQA